MQKIKHLQFQDIERDQIRVAYPQPLTDRQKYEQVNSLSKSTGRPFQKYYIEVKNYYTTAKISSDCNEITFINLGLNSVVVSGVPLQQNQSLRISGSIGEIDTTQWDIAFSTAISVNNNLIVLRKLYL